MQSMTTDETIQALRDELKAEKEARLRESASHESCVEDMGKMLNGIQAALIGSVHSKERGIRETINTHDSMLDNHATRIKTLEEADPACTGLTADDVKKLKDMPTAIEVKAGLSSIEKVMIYAAVVGSAIAIIAPFFQKK